MSEINPYESPRSPEPAVVAELVEAESGGIWRQGNLLVMHKRATLPDRCVLTNQPAHGCRLRRVLHWHHPLVYLAILAGFIGYFFLVVLVQQRAVVQIGLSADRIANRRRAILVAWGLVVASVVTAGSVLAVLGPHEDALVAACWPAALFLPGVLCGITGARTVTATRITDDYVWLKGVHSDYLAGLPVWPHPVLR